jgi:hypothetical protein
MQYWSYRLPVAGLHPTTSGVTLSRLSGSRKLQTIFLTSRKWYPSYHFANVSKTIVSEGGDLTSTTSRNPAIIAQILRTFNRRTYKRRYPPLGK